MKINTPRILPALSLLAAASVIAVSSSQAQSITSAGSEVLGESWQPNGIAWLTNGYGSFGYYLAKTNFGPGNNENYGAGFGYLPDQMTISAPSFGNLSTASDQVNNQTNYGYREYQHPSGSGKLSVGYMGRRFSGAMTPGQNYALFDFSITGSAPSSFNITISYHNEIGDTSIPSALTLTQIVGTGSDSVTIATETIPDFFKAGFSTFTVTGAQSGDVFRIFGTAQDTNNLLINAVMLQPIPEPGTYSALLGLAALGFAFARRRRAA